MFKLIDLIKRLRKDEDGAALIEYLAVSALIVTVGALIITQTGGELTTAANNLLTTATTINNP